MNFLKNLWPPLSGPLRILRLVVLILGAIGLAIGILHMTGNLPFVD